MTPDICLWCDLSLNDIKQLWKCESRDDIKRTLCTKFEYTFAELQTKEKILLDATFAYFKELLARHSVKRPPFCIYLFPVQEVVAITEYVVNTYFRHYKLYKYTFTSKVVMNVSIKYADMVEEECPTVEGGADRVVPEIENEDGSVEGSAEPLSVEADDPPAIKELKQIVEATLDEQIAKLKLDVDTKLKTNEESMMQHLCNNGSKDQGLKSASANKMKGKKGK